MEDDMEEIVTDNNTPEASTCQHPDLQLSLTFFKKLDATTGLMRRGKWNNFADRLCRGQTAPKSKHDLSLWAPVEFEGNRRRSQDAKQICAFVIDIDNEMKDTVAAKLNSPPATTTVEKDGRTLQKIEPSNEITQVLGVLDGFECCWHTSFSHRPDWPKYRVVWPLSRPVNPREYMNLWDTLNGRFLEAGVLLDPSTKNVSRVWFVAAQTPHFESGRVHGPLLDPDKVLKDASQPNGTERKSTTAKATSSANDRSLLVDIVSSIRYVRTPIDRVFAEIDGLFTPVDSQKFLEKVAFRFHVESLGHLVSKDSINNAMLAMRGRRLPVMEVPIRVAAHNRCTYIDLGDDTGRCIEIRRDHVKVLDKSPVGFFRPGTMRALPVPEIPRCNEEAQEWLRPFRRLLGVQGPQWSSCFAWSMSAMRPASSYTVLLCKGRKGSGKTTLARLLRRTIDPRRPEITGLPKDADDLAIKAENAHVLVFDNLRQLPWEMSDALCRLATLDGLEKRSLYTNRDLTALEAARPMILTSITDAATEPDLLDRSLIVNLGKREARMTDEEVDEEHSSIHPKVLGSLCFFYSLAMADESYAEVPADIRMRAQARFATGAEVWAGLGEGAIVEAYRNAMQEAASVASDDEFVAPFLKWAETVNEWSGTCSSLLEALLDHATGADDKARRPGWLPKSPRALRSKLDKFAGALSDLGVEISYESVGRGKDKRSHVVIESGACSETNAPRNAPHQTSSNSADGACGVDAVRSTSRQSAGADDENDWDGMDGDQAASTNFSRTRHPTGPTHPNPAFHRHSGGVRSNPNAPHAPHPLDDDDQYEEILEAVANV